MNLTKRIILLLCFLVPAVASAQFYVTGDDPGRLRWNYMDTESFRVIYPQGCDSLAKTYGYKLEKYKTPLSRSSGYIVGQGDGRLMPVVLHAYNTSNGSVAWAPKRMDLFSIPTPYEPEPMPWSTMLSVHEGRHVTQMQFGMTGVHKPFNYVFGEMWNILVSIVYPFMYYIEGDAVVAETALTKSGRGRTADFLNYYHVAFDQGDFRNWNRWLYGSQKYYTPDYYSLGYMNLAGGRYLYDYPLLMKDGYDKVTKNPFYFAPMKKMTRNRSGKKFKDAFREVCDTMHAVWSREDSLRAPFMPMESVTKKPRLYFDYKHLTYADDHIYAVIDGFLTSPILVRIDTTGRMKFISRFAHETSDLKYKEGKVYWTETMPDVRWSMGTRSKVRYISRSGGVKKDVTRNRDGLLYNPSFAGDTLATVRYYPEGHSSLVVDGQEYAAPDSLQLVETAWVDGIPYVTAVSDNGYGVYAYDGGWKTVLAPQPVMVKDFRSHENELMFTCDRTGVNELYHLDPCTGQLRQKSVTKYGAEDFTYSDDGKYVYFTSQTLMGKEMFRTPVDSLVDRVVDFADLHKYFLAEKMTEQERELAAAEGLDKPVDEDIEVEFSEPKRYRKAAHMFNLHSWAPVYVNVDNIMNLSFDYIYQAASLGVTGIMQNQLATGVGQIGYSAHKDPYDRSKWRHSGHFHFTYSGLYPVLEAKIDFNDRGARQYYAKAVLEGDGMASIGVGSSDLGVPSIQGSLKAYVPLNFSSGGWYKGVIPQVSYHISNDMFNTSMTVLKNEDNGVGYFPWNPAFLGVTEGKNTFRHSLTGSLRAYTITSTPNSAVYPRWGIGAELGVSADLESSRYFSPMGYAYIYGYVPGVMREQGAKITIWHQTMLNDKAYFGNPTLGILPRGLSSNPELNTWLSIRNSSITKWTADYAIPIYLGDVAIGGGFFYIKRLVLTPHFDFTHTANHEQLVSVGASAVLDLNSLLWLGWPVSMGVTWSYNGFADFTALKAQSGIDDMVRNHVGFVFNVTF